MIARELVKTVRANVTIDWTVREHGRANLRVLVKRRHAAVRVIRPKAERRRHERLLEQAELWGKEWTVKEHLRVHCSLNFL